MECFSIGYQGKSLPDLCAILKENGVKILIDVRERAWSQRPEFRKHKLRESLAECGIEYEHVKAAGNPYRPQNGHSPDYKQCVERFTEYLDCNPQITKTLESIVTKKKTVLFCYERERNMCHRNALFDSLSDVIRNLKVIDL